MYILMASCKQDRYTAHLEESLMMIVAVAEVAATIRRSSLIKGDPADGMQRT